MQLMLRAAYRQALARRRREGAIGWMARLLGPPQDTNFEHELTFKPSDRDGSKGLRLSGLLAPTGNLTSHRGESANDTSNVACTGICWTVSTFCPCS